MCACVCVNVCVTREMPVNDKCTLSYYYMVLFLVARSEMLPRMVKCGFVEYRHSHNHLTCNKRKKRARMKDPSLGRTPTVCSCSRC